MNAFAKSQAEFDLAALERVNDRLDRSREEFRDAIGLLSRFLTAMRMEGSNGHLTEKAWRDTEEAMRAWGLEIAL